MTTKRTAGGIDCLTVPLHGTTPTERMATGQSAVGGSTEADGAFRIHG